MKTGVGDQGIEIHILAPVGDNPPLRGKRKKSPLEGGEKKVPP